MSGYKVVDFAATFEVLKARGTPALPAAFVLPGKESGSRPTSSQGACTTRCGFAFASTAGEVRGRRVRGRRRWTSSSRCAQVRDALWAGACRCRQIRRRARRSPSPTARSSSGRLTSCNSSTAPRLLRPIRVRRLLQESSMTQKNLEGHGGSTHREEGRRGEAHAAARSTRMTRSRVRRACARRRSERDQVKGTLNRVAHLRRSQQRRAAESERADQGARRRPQPSATRRSCRTKGR
jgi:hypothetical protein